MEEVDCGVSCSLWTTSSDLTTVGIALLSLKHFQVSLISINNSAALGLLSSPHSLLRRAPIDWRTIGHILLAGKCLKSVVDTSPFHSSSTTLSQSL